MAKKIPIEVRNIQKNPPEEVNWAYQKNISHSQLNVYRGCPFRWKLQYKDKLRPFTSNIYSVFGKAIHEVIQHYLDVMYNKSVVKANKLNLEEEFQDSFAKNYQKEYLKNNSTHFSDAVEMREFYDDGILILEYFKKKKSKIFSKRGWHLVGCEIPVVNVINKAYPNVLYMGYLDVVLYHEELKRYHIIDLKTSTKGWTKWEKGDDKKTSQIVIYKKLFSDHYNIPIENVTVEFVILKRKLWEESDYPQTRIQSFIPSSGKTTIKKSITIVNDFISEVFDKKGNIKEIKYEKNPSKWTCSFCPFKDDEKVCGAGKYFS